MKVMTRNTTKTLSRIFLQGLAAVLPIAITLWAIYWLAVTAETFLGGLVQSLLPGWRYWTGLGVLLSVLLIFAAGLMMNAWITRSLLRRAEAVMERIPVVKTIYGSLRDLASFFSREGSKNRFHQVVTVTVGQMRLIGFVTRADFSKLPAGLGTEETVAVYLPMSYQIGGYTVYLPKNRIEPTDLSVEAAMRIVLTGGLQR
ncbi:MAG: DUF502 domain-containing protein [Burkholderiales bacterium]|nr:DUF502 domain-containing protein [Burkholderiales bacterium]